MIPRVQSLPDLSKGVGAAEGRIARIEQQVDILKDTIGGLEVGEGLELNVNAIGRVLIELGDIRAGDGDVGNYGFKTVVNGEGKVVVNTGTAQFWGGAVKVYQAADLGNAADGKFVYAILVLESGWAESLAYNNMTGQNPDRAVWIPIAAISGNANDGFTVTQLHWGNIVIPRTTNVVDVQVGPQEEE